MMNLHSRPDIPGRLEGARRLTGQLALPRSHNVFALRSVMDALHLTPEELGRLIGIPTRSVIRWLYAPISPSAAYWARIGYLLSLSVIGIDVQGRIRTLDWSEPPFRIEWQLGHEPTEEELESWHVESV